jgi:YHS domain-containing protein
LILRTILAMALVASFALTSAPPAWAQAQKTEKAEKVKDPVCNMNVDKNPKLSAKYKGKTYYFCMKADVESFKKDPEKYLKSKAHPHPA